ncbi:hypothetical protein M3G43_14540 [Brevibacterium casei]|uniref:hypothetical protein n=1 Tax=Brevibacterium casei TaxID=33889 RepID=UPI00223C4166|nr:hypothetical protein [Brevibacterium casei]MCT1448474.1 hypothetical protein [Brevibacterium casei]
MRGRHSYMLSSIFSVRFGLEAAPRWFLVWIIGFVSAMSLGRGLDLALDPTTGTEILAYANILGANTWGWVQTGVSATVLLMLANRWTVGLITAQIASTAVWLAYAVSILQALIGILPTEGGLRNFIIPLTLAGLYTLSFIATTAQLRRRAATDGRGL